MVRSVKFVVAIILFAQLASAALTPEELLARHQDNLAYASPFANYPHLAVEPSQVARTHLLTKRDANADVSFIHGVASGDPLSDRVILWTRVSPQSASVASASVSYEVSTTRDFATIVKTGTVVTSADVDWTVKVDATDLAPQTTYFYRFNAGGVVSPVGRTKTFPAANATVDNLRLGLVSCSNMPHGYFVAYRQMAKKDLDAVIHLGDYIYEYDLASYPAIGGALPAERNPMPAKTITSLSDYRQRHAQYKTDADLQLVHAAHPFIQVWDDHEFADNAFQNGSLDHKPATDGTWATRKLVAARAFHEYIPIRTGEASADLLKIYRGFKYGDLVDLLMLDTRIEGRETGGNGWTGKDRPTRKLIGAEQEKWLHTSLVESKAQWKVLGNQIILAQMPGKILDWEWSVTGDMWIAYPTTRNALLGLIEDKKINNVVVLTGDFHSSVASDLYRDERKYERRSGKGSVAVEFAVTSVTSAGPAQDSWFLNKLAVPVVHATNKGAKFVDLYQHGYMLVNFDRQRVRTEHYFMRSIKDRADDTEILGAVLESNSGSNRITKTYIP
ncbi:PhoD-like phosphatase-domain-containing protein [Catenaria anguillulae PL171]|uniref:PhoD-like phosphatase-domain-containing protein n=1 Tax=Catenaria anguillulae PL171 TaxID=765915 RepID=A0A1Y2HN45_9FUNG|nr:PhoD-like phosphatase-domain-containing protein [Catenaria anguillulae PL171]